MSLNEIRFPSSVLAGLYANSLIDDSTGSIAADPPGKADTIIEVPEHKESAWSYLGENQKNILLLVDHKNEGILPEEELSFLKEILTACTFTLADVAILNIHHHPGATYKEFIPFFKSKSIVLFAVTPGAIGLPVDFPLFQVQGFDNRNFLCAPPLSGLQTDKLLKSKLWVCLRRLFGI